MIIGVVMDLFSCGCCCKLHVCPGEEKFLSYLHHNNSYKEVGNMYRGYLHNTSGNRKNSQWAMKKKIPMCLGDINKGEIRLV